MTRKKTVYALGYEFEANTIPSHVTVGGTGTGRNLRVACQRAIADMLADPKLAHKQIGAFKLRIEVFADVTYHQKITIGKGAAE